MDIMKPNCWLNLADHFSFSRYREAFSPFYKLMFLCILTFSTVYKMPEYAATAGTAHRKTDKYNQQFKELTESTQPQPVYVLCYVLCYAVAAHSQKVKGFSTFLIIVMKPLLLHFVCLLILLSKYKVIICFQFPSLHFQLPAKVLHRLFTIKFLFMQFACTWTTFC